MISAKKKVNHYKDIVRLLWKYQDDSKMPSHSWYWYQSNPREEIHWKNFSILYGESQTRK